MVNNDIETSTAGIVREQLQDAPAGIVRLLERGDAYVAGREQAFPMGLLFDQLGRDVRFALFAAAQTAEDRFNALAYMAAMRWLHFDLVRAARRTGFRLSAELTFNDTMGQDVTFLQAVGWPEHARQMASYLWVDYPDAGEEGFFPDDYALYAPQWFNTLTLVPPGVWRERGFEPHSLGLYQQLLDSRDLPDEAAAAALQQLRDHNLQSAVEGMRDPAARVPMVDAFVLMFDQDIRAENAERLRAGKAPLAVDSRLSGPQPDTRPVPFAVEPRVHAIYERLCAEMGTEPYRAPQAMEVRLDPQTLLIRRV